MKKLMKRTKNKFDTVGTYKDTGEYSCDCETTKCFCYTLDSSQKEAVKQNPKVIMKHQMEHA